MDKNGANFQVIYTFSDLSLGYFPVGGVIENAGKLYGMFEQSSGGAGLFSINLDGTGYTALKFFAPGGLTGPAGGLRFYRGYLYGSCQSGGAALVGGIFRIRPDGSGYQQLHEFNTTEGAIPRVAPNRRKRTSAGHRSFGQPAAGTVDRFHRPAKRTISIARMENCAGAKCG